MVGIESDVDAAAMIEPQRPVHRRHPMGADREVSAELLLKRGSDAKQVAGRKFSVALIAECSRVRAPALGSEGQLGFFLLTAGHGGDLTENARARRGQINRLAAAVQFLLVGDKRRGGGSARGDQSLRLIQGALLTSHPALGGSDHIRCLFFGEIRDADGTVKGLTKSLVILSVSQFLLNAGQTGPRQDASLDLHPDFFCFLLRLLQFGRHLSVGRK